MDKYISFCEKYSINYVIYEEDMWINLSKIGKVLNIKNIRSAITNYPKSYFMKVKIPTNGGDQLVNFINIDGLHR